MVSGCLHAKIQASIHKRTKLNQLINLFGSLMNIPKCSFSKVPNVAQKSCGIKMWKRTKALKLFIDDVNFIKDLN